MPRVALQGQVNVYFCCNRPPPFLWSSSQHHERFEPVDVAGVSGERGERGVRGVRGDSGAATRSSVLRACRKRFAWCSVVDVAGYHACSRVPCFSMTDIPAQVLSNITCWQAQGISYSTRWRAQVCSNADCMQILTEDSASVRHPTRPGTPSKHVQLHWLPRSWRLPKP